MATGYAIGDGGNVTGTVYTTNTLQLYTTSPSPIMPKVYTSPPAAPNLFVGGQPLTFPDYSVSLRPGLRLTQAQMDLLMRGHQFIPMDASGFCLFCFAFDLYRMRTDHGYVIHEE